MNKPTVYSYERYALHVIAQVDREILRSKRNMAQFVKNAAALQRRTMALVETVRQQRRLRQKGEQRRRMALHGRNARFVT